MEVIIDQEDRWKFPKNILAFRKDFRPLYMTFDYQWNRLALYESNRGSLTIDVSEINNKFNNYYYKEI